MLSIDPDAIENERDFRQILSTHGTNSFLFRGIHSGRHGQQTQPVSVSCQVMSGQVTFSVAPGEFQPSLGGATIVDHTEPGLASVSVDTGNVGRSMSLVHGESKVAVPGKIVLK